MSSSQVMFNEGAIEYLSNNQDQPMFESADLGRILGIEKVENMTIPSTFLSTRFEIVGSKVASPKCPLGKAKNGHDVFVTLEDALKIVRRSKKPKAVGFIKWLARAGVKKLKEELKEQRQALEDRIIDINILENNLHDTDSQLMVLGDEIEELQDQVEALQRAVPYHEDPGKDNGMVIIQKNNDPFPYMAICGQQRYVAQKIQNKLGDYPKGEIVVLAETPDAIVHYNWLQERGCIEVNPERVRHIRLGKHYTHERLLELAE